MNELKVIVREVVDSTNNYASEYCRETEGPFAVVAGYQSKGKGQRGNNWLSVAGQNLLISLVIDLNNLQVSKNFFLSKIAALSVHSVVSGYSGDTFIKWPNDIITCKKKISGILIENTITGSNVSRSIIGVGININQTDFPAMEPVAISLKMITQKEEEISEVQNSLIEVFFKYLEILEVGNYDRIDDEYFSKLLNFEKWADYIEGRKKLRGRIVDVMDDGYMVMETEDGQYRKFGFGDIRYLEN